LPPPPFERTLTVNGQLQRSVPTFVHARLGGDAVLMLKFWS
jgi:hypothetical protein